MNPNLVSKVGDVSVDNLIAKILPPAECFGIKIAALAASSDDVTLKRGTVLGRAANGKYSIYGGSSEAKTVEFNGDGTATTFTLTDKPAAVIGVKVGTSDATVSDYNPYTGVVTLSAAPAAGTKNVKVSYTLDTDAVPAAILADDVTVTDDGDAVAVAYRCGNFNRKALIVAEGYTLTAADEDALRKYNIILTDTI